MNRNSLGWCVCIGCEWVRPMGWIEIVTQLCAERDFMWSVFRCLTNHVKAIVEKPLFSETARQEQNVERFVANSVAGRMLMVLRLR